MQTGPIITTARQMITPSHLPLDDPPQTALFPAMACGDIIELCHLCVRPANTKHRRKFSDCTCGGGMIRESVVSITCSDGCRGNGASGTELCHRAGVISSDASAGRRTLQWPARPPLTLATSRIDRILWRKCDGMAGAHRPQRSLFSIVYYTQQDLPFLGQRRRPGTLARYTRRLCRRRTPNRILTNTPAQTIPIKHARRFHAGRPIWARLAERGCKAVTTYSDVPFCRFGVKYLPIIRISTSFMRLLAGTLPRVRSSIRTFVGEEVGYE